MDNNYRTVKGHVPVRAQRWYPGTPGPVASNTKLVDGVHQVDGTGDVLGVTVNSGDWLVIDFGGEWRVMPDAEFLRLFEEVPCAQASQ